VKVAVVGHGRTGSEVAEVLKERSYEPVIVGRGDAFPTDCPVGIDFTVGAAVPGNVQAALAAGARYVVGTTGWGEHLEAVTAAVALAGGGLVHAANFSIGVNLFYRIVRQAAALLARFPDYDPYLLERHHRGKKDAPSGTAKVLASIVAEAGGRRRVAATSLATPLAEDAFGVSSVRAGGIVGEHVVGFDAGVDEILLEHRARSRRGFALGAVLAAEWIVTRTGVFTFEDVLDAMSRDAAR
jgi:4-hydroxy-tetrahydrodipicolinate reductase